MVQALTAVCKHLWCLSGSVPVYSHNPVSASYEIEIEALSITEYTLHA